MVSFLVHHEINRFEIRFSLISERILQAALMLSSEIKKKSSNFMLNCRRFNFLTPLIFHRLHAFSYAQCISLSNSCSLTDWLKH